jgi:hypothetical protein
MLQPSLFTERKRLVPPNFLDDSGLLRNYAAPLNRCQRCDLIFRARNDQDTGHRCKKPKTRRGKRKGKVKFNIQQTTKTQRVMGGQRHAPAALPPGKETRYPLYRRLGGPQGRSVLERKISPPSGFDPRTFQPAASRYTE